jgi:ribonuclease D
MAEYAINDTHYLLPLAGKLEQELIARGRLEWFRQSCARAIEQSGVQRARDASEAWRISGAGKLRGRAAAVLRELWRWREAEAQAADRPPFHILQNHLLIQAAEDFAADQTPQFRHFSSRRAATFQEAANRGLQMPETEWPERPRRVSTRPTREMERVAEELKTRRDCAAKELDLDPAVIAPRATLEAIAANKNDHAALLVTWQRELLSLN